MTKQQVIFKRKLATNINYGSIFMKGNSLENCRIFENDIVVIRIERDLEVVNE